MNFPWEGPKFFWETYVLNFFGNITFSCLFLYRHATSHWKGLKEGYNFVVESTLIIIHMKMLQSHKVSNTFVLQGTWLLLSNLSFCSPRHMVGLKEFFMSLEEKWPKLPQAITVSFGEKRPKLP
jgi:hypothetical protein